jgi:hypothetical protein
MYYEEANVTVVETSRQEMLVSNYLKKMARGQLATDEEHAAYLEFLCKEGK